AGSSPATGRSARVPTSTRWTHTSPACSRRHGWAVRCRTATATGTTRAGGTGTSRRSRHSTRPTLVSGRAKADNRFVRRLCFMGVLCATVLLFPAGAAEGAPAGRVVAWGCQDGGNWGQCSIPSGLTTVTAVAAGQYHSLALRRDGTVVAWGCGLDNAGQCSVPGGLSGVTAIAAGAFHSLALKSDGTVVAWGCGIDNGQCTVPDGLSGVVAIAAHDYHSVALRSDGTVVVWGCGGGTNDGGQCSVPAGLAGVGAIAAGRFHNLALIPLADQTIDFPAPPG